MSGIGFFTRQEAQRSKKTKTKRRVSDETLRRIGPSGVAGMNPVAHHPQMEPAGCLEQPLVYVLGEAPGLEEDAQGQPCVGKAVRLLRNAIPTVGAHQTAFDNCVRTLPPDGRKPTHQEIECFRGAVERSIESAKPAVVLGLGATPLEWATGLKKPKVYRGKRYPVQIGSHRCWFIPTLHPGFLENLKRLEIREDKVPWDEWIRVFENDVARAYKLAEDGPVPPKLITPDEARAGIVHCRTLGEVEEALEFLSAEPQYVGWDLETHRLRPYYSDARVLSIALSDGHETFAFGLQHDESGWSEKEYRRVLQALEHFFLSNTKKVAHHAPFDVEWMLWLLGEKLFDRWDTHHDTLQAAFALNPGPPDTSGGAGHALNDLCLEYFGLALKALSPDAQAKDNLRNISLTKLLDYNALDAKWTARLFMEYLMDEAPAESYALQMARIPTILLAQRAGIPVDQSETRRLQAELIGQIDQMEESLLTGKSVRRYEQDYGTFNADSPKDVLKLLTKVINLPVGSTDKKVLQDYRDYKVVDQILSLRELSKLKGTYVDRFLPEDPETYVFPDGLIHPIFGITRTRTARLSSDSPNVQNFPTRKNAQIKKQLAAPPGMMFVSVDQGQIEARVLAMESKDKTWIRMIYDDYDIHSEWATKLASIDPEFMDRMDGDKKKARHAAKNGWVFPAFFGSSLSSIATNLQLPEKPAERLFKEFWNTFKGIKSWQRTIWEKYQRDNLVRTLTGRVRLAPLSYNAVINTGIQGVASDICVDAMVRLSDRARKEKLPWLQPRIQIHDDLTFLIPIAESEDGTEIIIRECLGFKAPWLNVPLSVEVKIGDNLYEMQPIGSWRSDQI